MLTSNSYKFKSFQNYILIFVVSLYISSCVKEEMANVQYATLVDNDLQSYFSLFEEEGKTRGVAVDLIAAQISGEIVFIEETNVAGQCSVNTQTGQKTIRIDRRYWAKATALDKEFLIFHELGHCFLERRHVDSKDVRGNCESIMHSGIGDCKFQYTTASRAAYLDELFDN